MLCRSCGHDMYGDFLVLCEEQWTITRAEVYDALLMALKRMEGLHHPHRQP